MCPSAWPFSLLLARMHVCTLARLPTHPSTHSLTHPLSHLPAHRTPIYPSTHLLTHPSSLPPSVPPSHPHARPLSNPSAPTRTRSHTRTTACPTYPTHPPHHLSVRSTHSCPSTHQLSSHTHANPPARTPTRKHPRAPTCIHTHTSIQTSTHHPPIINHQPTRSTTSLPAVIHSPIYPPTQSPRNSPGTHKAPGIHSTTHPFIHCLTRSPIHTYTHLQTKVTIY
ncbi:Protein of unknown function [Gryllus bimaculatus]|nr:Protein of unknown function [Gryllus bimaculatus]